MKNRFFHCYPPHTSIIRSPEEFRSYLWLDEFEIEQRNQIDAKLVSFARDLEIIMEIGGKFVRKEYSSSQAQSLVLTTNYRYVLTANEMENFFNRTSDLSDLFIDLNQRLCIGYSPRLIDVLITRTYSALTISPTESNPDGVVDHDIYPHFWLYPYFKERLHELLSVGIPH